MRASRAAWVGLLAAITAACADGVVSGPRDAAADAVTRRDATTPPPSDATGPLDVVAEPLPPPPDAAPDADVERDAVISPPTDAPADTPPDTSAGITCPSGGAIDCSRGPGTGEADTCFRGTSCFIGNVQTAVRRAIAANPGWFDMTSMPGCAVVVQVDEFMAFVAMDIQRQGLCAIRDPNAPREEVTVKHDNAFSENFDIVASTGCARYGSAIYTGYCAPAWW